MSDPSSSIAVFGPGLMGGSLLMALRRNRPDARLLAWARRDEVLGEIRTQNLADECSTDPEEIAQAADLIVLCVPVDKMSALAGKIAGVVSAKTTVTDVGSVKEPVVEELEHIFARTGNFVGSHPMCGSEEAGLSAARRDLYENALCVVTPTPTSLPAAVRAAGDLWRTVGARVFEMSPHEHDAAAAAVSHVPHIAAASLVELVARSQPVYRKLCAGGFRDTTRVASGSPELWTSILELNRREISGALGNLADILQSMKAALEKNDTATVQAFFESAAKHRADILKGE
jgi:prephenate dehydrogenase